MLLSKSGEYALNALVYIAAHEDECPLRTGEIAAAQGAPANYLSKLLHQLASGGVLHSTRGPRGGFSLAVAPEDLTLERALAPIQSVVDSRCLLGRPECSDADPCAAHDRWRALASHIERFLGETTLADLQRGRARAGRSRPASQRKTERRIR